ncbi:MAG: hypothetical protein ACREMR_06260 [Gemmatimonadales bacterium]
MSGRSVARRALGPALLALVWTAGPHPAGLAAQTVDTVIVENASVFDDTDSVWYARIANLLHVRTRPWLVRRTLLVRSGDPYDSATVAESERNLRTLGVFRRVVLDTLRLEEGRLAVRAATGDGWSTKPEVSFSFGGGDGTWSVGLVEENFLGTATLAAVSYRRTPDRQSLDLSYKNPHLFGRGAPLELLYSDLSDGTFGAWHLGVPFTWTGARRSLETDGTAADRLLLVYRDGVLDQTYLQNLLGFAVRGGVALAATSRDYTRLWFGLEGRREDYAPVPVTALPYSTFATAGLGVELGHVRFRVMHHFNSYARGEDVNLSQILRLGVWAAPRAWGYPGHRAGVAPEVRAQLASRWRHGFARVQLLARGVYVPTAGAVDSGRVRGNVTVVSGGLPRQTWIVFVEGGLARRPAPNGEFDLWLEGRGPRGFPAHAFTGTRMAWGTIENRILVIDELWGLMGLGLAPFVDWGGAWYDDEPSRFGVTTGLSLRLGSTRSTRGGAGEFALGYRLGEGFSGSGWALAIRRGFVF